MSNRLAKGSRKGTGYLQRIRDMLNVQFKAGDPTGWMRIGNSPYNEPSSSMPLTPAVPVPAHVNIFEFKEAYNVNTTNVWNEAAVGSGTGLAVQDARGGKAKFTNGASDNNYYSYFSKYEIGKLSAGKGLWLFGTIEIADVSEADWFIGLCTQLGAGNLFDTRVDAIGFYGEDGSVNINCECSQDSVATQSTGKGTLADATEKYFFIYVNGTTAVHFYLGDSDTAMHHVDNIKTNLPDDEEMSVAFGCRNGTGSANSMTLGQIKLIQDL